VPTTLTPTTFADGGLGSGSLRDVVLQFNADTGTDDDTILLEAGTYALTIRNVGGQHETAGLTGDLNLTQTSHRWIIQGAGSSGTNATIIDASQLMDRVFEIVTPGTQVVFQDLVLQGGLAQDDGSEGALAGTTDALGGGLLNTGGDVTLDNVVLQNNVARGGDAAALSTPGHNARGGGIYSTGGALTLTGASLANNQAIGGRGGDHYYSYPAGAGGSASGGGLYASGGALEISDSRIASNRTIGGEGGDGTGNGTSGAPGGLGGAGQGGGLYVNGGSLMISITAIASNQGIGGNGGADGYPGYGEGGGLYNAGTLTVSSTTFTGNSATVASFYGLGGGIYNFGTLTVRNSILSGNAATNHGGGIYNAGTLTVSSSTLSGNRAHVGGGGILNFGALIVSNSTLSGNSAVGDTGSVGGGIYNRSDTRPVTLINVTLTANRAGIRGGGLVVFTGAPVVHNTLIAGNLRGATGATHDDVFGALNAGGDYNLIGDGTGMRGLSNGVNGNQVGSADNPIEPQLGPLDDNGGPTLTHALLSGSPAIDAGNNAYATDFDQRGPGFPRIVNGIIDIGAFEFQGAGPGPSTSRSSRGQEIRVEELVANGGNGLGGGLYVAGGTASVLDTAIRHNRALGGDGDAGSNGGNGLGGGVYVTAGTVIVSASDISYNQALGGLGDSEGTDGLGVGAGVYNLGTFLFDAATVLGHNYASTSDDDCFGC